MDLLAIDWNQAKPDEQEAKAMCRLVPITQHSISTEDITSTIQEIARSHGNGAAFLAAFHIGTNHEFDWFASRNRLLEFNILRSLLTREEVASALPLLEITKAVAAALDRDDSCGGIIRSADFEMASPFSFDGQLAQTLYSGGAYGSGATGDGRAQKEAALGFCEAAFSMRFSELLYYRSHAAWTPWFGNIAWDWTAILFDKRLRKLWILVVTDTD